MMDNKFFLSEDECVALGCDFITFFSERSNFFEVRDVKVKFKKDLRKRIIIPKSDLKHILNAAFKMPRVHIRCSREERGAVNVPV